VQSTSTILFLELPETDVSEYFELYQESKLQGYSIFFKDCTTQLQNDVV